jgi:hypothetical protein
MECLSNRCLQSLIVDIAGNQLLFPVLESGMTDNARNLSGIQLCTVDGDSNENYMTICRRSAGVGGFLTSTEWNTLLSPVQYSSCLK